MSGAWPRPFMKPHKIFAVLCALPLVAGCVNIKGERTGPDGSRLSISAQRFLWVSQGMEFSTQTEDTIVTLKASTSKSDADSIAVLSGALSEVAKTAIAK